MRCSIQCSKCTPESPKISTSFGGKNGQILAPEKDKNNLRIQAMVQPEVEKAGQETQKRVHKA